VAALADRLNGAPTEAPLAGLVIVMALPGVCVGPGAAGGDDGGDDGDDEVGDDGEGVVDPAADFDPPPPHPVPCSTIAAANRERVKE
jgi:hypothetical protein